MVVGGGQSGLAIASGLLRAQVSNILVVDRAPSGQEGPWLSYARMHTLRSPKDYTGPDLDLPSLGYQAWHEARYGAVDWQSLQQIARPDWAAYLDWVRETVGIPVRNQTRGRRHRAGATRALGRHLARRRWGRSPVRP